jgi:RAD3-like DEAD/DEAH box helicase
MPCATGSVTYLNNGGRLKFGAADVSPNFVLIAVRTACLSDPDPYYANGRFEVADFKKLSAARPQEAPTDPFRVFQRLPKPPHINDLWESQSEALKLWSKRRAEGDLVIKLNTGGGKTLVGLLIGQALLNELHKPVLCLCPTRQLVQQTLEKLEKSVFLPLVTKRGLRIAHGIPQRHQRSRGNL